MSIQRKRLSIQDPSRQIDHAMLLNMQIAKYADRFAKGNARGSSTKAEKVDRLTSRVNPKALQRVNTELGGTAETFAAKGKRKLHITTGSKQLDRILGGGIECCCVTEVFGDRGSGKSVLGETLPVNCQLPVAMGGAAAPAFVIGGESARSRAEMLISLAERHNLDPQLVLDNVFCAQAHNVDNQMMLLRMAQDTMSRRKFALIVVDDATENYSYGHPVTADFDIFIRTVANVLELSLSLAEKFECAVVIIHRTIPVEHSDGGLSHYAIKHRVNFSRGSGSMTIAKVRGSRWLEEDEAYSKISGHGIDDMLYLDSLRE